jgi:hypothetical protein
MINDIKVVLEKRIKERLPKDFVSITGLEHFYLAGNSLNNETPNDLDIYPIKPFVPNEKINKYIISRTRNAITLKLNNIIIQICNYFKPSLKDLVESFDFAHVKIGAELEKNIYNVLDVKEIYISEDWIKAKLLCNTWFTGSDYPLSSLIRTAKYIKRKNFSGKSYIFSFIAILNSIIKRGFTDYIDFKDQLDAIDLGLLPEDFKEMDNMHLLELFNLLKK